MSVFLAVCLSVNLHVTLFLKFDFETPGVHYYELMPKSVGGLTLNETLYLLLQFRRFC